MSTLQPSSHKIEPLPKADPVKGRTKSRFYENKALQYIHDMRIEVFDRRCDDNRSSTKPYLPMLISDEKEVIDEQLMASKN